MSSYITTNNTQLDIENIGDIVNDLSQKMPISGIADLATSATNTVIENANIHAGAVIILQAGSSGMTTTADYVVAGDKQFTIYHSSYSTVKKYHYVVLV